jgi:phosphoglucosamine mutase
MSNIGMRMAFEEAGIDVLETQVGDRYVLQEMLDKGALLGGEQSGHIILLKESTTGDGILSALKLLAVIKDTGRSLEELAGQMRRYPQVLVNAIVGTKEGWDRDPVILKGIREVEDALAGRGRLLVRPSGTEPKIRVMAEGPDPGELQGYAEKLAEVIRARQAIR